VSDDLEAFSRAWEDLFRATRRRRARHEATDDGPITIPQYLLLEPLLRGEALAVRELAEQAGVQSPTATRMLDGLEKAGFVTRSPSPRDRRMVDVRLTPEGTRVVGARREQIDDWRRRLYEALPEADREQAAQLLRRLTEALEGV
jgi:DNA-binding MarR family transcriptional regulator